jgi:hypothetical protein
VTIQNVFKENVTFIPLFFVTPTFVFILMKHEIITNFIDKTQPKEANKTASKNVTLLVFAAKIIAFWKPKTNFNSPHHPFLLLKHAFEATKSGLWCCNKWLLAGQ